VLLVTPSKQLADYFLFWPKAFYILPQEIKKREEDWNAS
jgi:hypothetical protein